MRRVLIALAFVAGFALSAGPALAQEGSDGPTDTVTPSQTTEPTPEETTPAPEETTAPPTDASTPPVEETPGTGDPTPGNDQNSGSDKSGGTGGSGPSAAKAATNSQEDPVDNLGDTVEGKTVKVCQASGSGTFTTAHVSAVSVQDGSGVGGGDIVKPFTYSGGGFDGLNWDTGKSIYNNDCTAPADASAPGGGAITETCETATEVVTATLTLTEGASAAPNPGCEEASFEILAVVDKVDICHARSAVTNPYGPQRINVSVNSIFNPNNGHDTHDGPVFPAADWGDIIPPFEAESGFYPGQNWDAEGQAFWFNNCQIPDEEPPPPGEEKVDICHARSSQTNPYGPGLQNVSVNSIVNPNGHGTHDGPVFFPGASDWGDIIPPFEYGDNESFPGLNWDSDGQAIYFNNCQVPGDEDDDDGDGDDDDGDEEDGDDDDGGGALPDTGGQSLWILLVGGMLTVLGMTILSSSGSMGRIGLFGPALLDVPAMPWSSTIDRAADLPVTVVKPESHRTGWTVFGVLMLVAAILGRRAAK